MPPARGRPLSVVLDRQSSVDNRSWLPARSRKSSAQNSELSARSNSLLVRNSELSERNRWSYPWARTKRRNYRKSPLAERNMVMALRGDKLCMREPLHKVPTSLTRDWKRSELVPKRQ